MPAFGKERPRVAQRKMEVPRGDAKVRASFLDTPLFQQVQYKTDMYGRFVADVFYHPTLKDKEDVAEDGFFLNQEILKIGLAKLMIY